MKIKGIIIIVLSVMLLSCDSSSITHGRFAYKKYLQEVLKDPGSLKIYKEKIIKEEKYSVTIEVDYGAKNSYGAYVRKTSIFEVTGKILIVDGVMVRPD